MYFQACGAGFRAFCGFSVLRWVVVSLLCLQAPVALAGSLEKRKSEVNVALSAKAWDKAFSLCHEVLSRGDTSKVLWLAAGKAAFHLGFPKAAGRILDRGEVEAAASSALRNRFFASAVFSTSLSNRSRRRKNFASTILWRARMAQNQKVDFGSFLDPLGRQTGPRFVPGPGTNWGPQNRTFCAKKC